MNALPHSPVKVFVLRLRPHEDLKKALQTFAADNNLAAAIVLTCTGSLRQYNLRFANQKVGVMRSGHFEIVSLTGTLSVRQRICTFPFQTKPAALPAGICSTTT